MRQGVEPKGIIAAGRTASGWKLVPSYRNDGTMQNGNDPALRFIHNPNRPLISLRRLLKIQNKPDGLWLSASSGIRIPDDTAEKLELAWPSPQHEPDVDG